MSRCFPYPPPGYCRNGATHDALIESIKLQTEPNKIKAERKKEKKNKKEKKEKSHKHKRNKEELEAQIKKTEVITEVFEKSDLTQEHGQPISPHQPSYSSDSTQNSNKRKRDDYSLLPDSSAGHGSFKIRLLKKQKGLDSSNPVADVRSNICLPVPSSSNSDWSLVSSIGKNGVSANRMQTKTNPISQGTKISEPHILHLCRLQSFSSSAKPIIESTRPQQQVLPQIHMEHEIPSSSVSRNIDVKGFYTDSQQLASSNHLMFDADLKKTSTSVPANGGMMKPKEDLQKVGPTRSEKKMMKKHVKYEKLIGSWLPPVSHAYVPDDDWLSSSKASSSSISKGEVETCREFVASWQPCARFLAEVDIHALPYTVPF